MVDVFEGGFIKPEFLKTCIEQVKHKYEPKVLILSRTGFHRLLNAIALHGHSHHIVSGYKQLGIEKVIWAEDLPDYEFMLSSGKGLEGSIETITFK